MTNFNEMTAKELVAAYNDMAKAIDDALVIRFADRKTGIRRCEKMAEKYAAAFPQVEEKTEARNPNQCPSCGTEDDQTSAGTEGTAADERNFCHHCATEYWVDSGKIYNEPARSASRSAAIAKSWEDPKVAAKRAQRHAVRVAGQEFRSVRAAFVALNLPLSRHIKFRMELKAAGSAEAFGYNWEIIEA